MARKESDSLPAIGRECELAKLPPGEMFPAAEEWTVKEWAELMSKPPAEKCVVHFADTPVTVGG